MAVLHVADQTDDPLLLRDGAQGVCRQPYLRDIGSILRQELTRRQEGDDQALGALESRTQLVYLWSFFPDPACDLCRAEFSLADSEHA